MQYNPEMLDLYRNPEFMDMTDEDKKKVFELYVQSEMLPEEKLYLSPDYAAKHVLPKETDFNLFFKSYADPNFQKLSPEAKVQAIGSYYDSQIQVSENLPDYVKEARREIFIQQNLAEEDKGGYLDWFGDTLKSLPGGLLTVGAQAWRQIASALELPENLEAMTPEQQVEAMQQVKPPTVIDADPNSYTNRRVDKTEWENREMQEAAPNMEPTPQLPPQIPPSALNPNMLEFLVNPTLPPAAIVPPTQNPIDTQGAPRGRHYPEATQFRLKSNDRGYAGRFPDSPSPEQHRNNEPDSGQTSSQRGARGKPAKIAIPNRKDKLPAHYAIMEADSVQASHLPEAGWQKNPSYGLTNERQYHSEPASQAKVHSNALSLYPELLLEAPDANQGAPVIDFEGNVLGVAVPCPLNRPMQASPISPKLIKNTS